MAQPLRVRLVRPQNRESAPATADVGVSDPDVPGPGRAAVGVLVAKWNGVGVCGRD